MYQGILKKDGQIDTSAESAKINLQLKYMESMKDFLQERHITLKEEEALLAFHEGIDREKHEAMLFYTATKIVLYI